MEDSKIVYAPKSKMEKGKLTVFGAGKFGESKLILCKDRAALLYMEIHAFLVQESIFDKNQTP